MSGVEIERAYQSVSTASRELGVPSQTVYRWIATNRLSAASVDGLWLVERSSVAALKRERDAEANAGSAA